VLRNHLISSGGRERNCQEGKRSSQRNLEPWRFSSRAKSQKEVCAELCKECRRSFENSLSLEREIVLSAQRSRGLVEVQKMEKSPIVKEETGGRRSRGSGEGTSEGLREQTRIFAKSRREISIQVVGSGRTRGKGSMHRWFISQKSRVERRQDSQSPNS
jgi:hypothetical protein